jgi:hypothetical protein
MMKKKRQYFEYQDQTRSEGKRRERKRERERARREEMVVICAGVGIKLHELLFQNLKFTMNFED